MSTDITVGITGASGAAYATRFIEQLIAHDRRVHLVVSPFGRRLLADELNITQVTPETLVGHSTDNLVIHPYNDLGSRLASGSFAASATVVCPCSANTLGAIAAGLGDNLINRMVQVALKERRRVLLVYREMPMSHIDLQNALTVSQAGAVFCPANPGFYMLPTSVADIVDFVVGKMLDLCGVDHALATRWDPEAHADKTGE